MHQSHLSSVHPSHFFLPNFFKHANWKRLVQEVVDSVINGKVSIVMDKDCTEFTGLEGVYKAQAYMWSGKNVGKIYAPISPHVMCT